MTSKIIDMQLQLAVEFGFTHNGKWGGSKCIKICSSFSFHGQKNMNSFKGGKATKAFLMVQNNGTVEGFFYC